MLVFIWLVMPINKVQRNIIFVSLSYTIIYLLWVCIAFVYNVNNLYIFQDSLGLLILIFGLIIFSAAIGKIDNVYINENFLRFIIKFITLISLLMFCYYNTLCILMPSNPIPFINEQLKKLNLNWIIDHNLGMIGLYTWCAQFLLIGVALAFEDLANAKKKSLLKIALLSFAVFLDGHRALLFALMLQIFISSLYFLARKQYTKIYTFFVISLVFIFVAFVVKNEWFIKRMLFQDPAEKSLQTRFDQTQYLINEIKTYPLFGKGFGAQASEITNFVRPFGYEMDYLATVMKLGFFGSILFLGIYFYVLYLTLKIPKFSLFYFSVGFAFFLYIGTNGYLVLSTDSMIFLIFYYLLVVCKNKKKELHFIYDNCRL